MSGPEWRGSRSHQDILEIWRRANAQSGEGSRKTQADNGEMDGPGRVRGIDCPGYLGVRRDNLRCARRMATKGAGFGSGSADVGRVNRWTVKQ